MLSRLAVGIAALLLTTTSVGAEQPSSQDSGGASAVHSDNVPMVWIPAVDPYDVHLSHGDLAMRYINRSFSLATLKQQQDRGFCVTVDKDGTGHLDPCNPGKKTVLPGTEQITKEKEGQITLSLKAAEQLWGQSRKQYNGVTFDARSMDGDEPNIYHLDFHFDHNNLLSRYRIRGIGITKPAWVACSTQL